ncbi:HEPN domain-containing protein [Microcystis aeruginosa CS-564/01]|uniref:HEPN domain-containing protein n=1 Tax=Microcystis aeruginosa TaxID=1126 RepID=UPI0023301EEE|nr:HEPN domain-containing protein [Microcystis aeruginosa]MDB9424345.1 HEPN domain-containing protein [Microcystis aeruginosa CS-564/01]
MPKSLRFRQLTKELNRLKKQFLPRKFSEINEYSERQLALTFAYRFFAHAEIESYLEDRVWDTVQTAKNIWDNQGKASRVLLCVIAFSGQEMEAPPDTITPLKGKKNMPEDKLKINKKIDMAIGCFKSVIDQNHGIKETNLLKLLLPIGIDSDDLDQVWLANMNTFGKERGEIAHSSAIKTKQPPNPADELERVKQIIQELEKVDQLITNLLK